MPASLHIFDTERDMKLLLTLNIMAWAALYNVAALEVFIGGESIPFTTGHSSSNGLKPSLIDTGSLTQYFNSSGWDSATVYRYSYTASVNNTSYRISCFCPGSKPSEGNCACDKPNSHLKNYLSNFESLFSSYPKSRYVIVLSSSTSRKIFINGTHDPHDKKVNISKGDPGNGNSNDNGAESLHWSNLVLGSVLLVSPLLF